MVRRHRGVAAFSRAATVVGALALAAGGVLAVPAGTAAPASPPASSSRIVELATTAGASGANDVSPNGRYVTGFVETSDRMRRAALWTADGTALPLATPPDVQTDGFAVNDDGMVAGWWSGCASGSCDERAVVWSRTGAVVRSIDGAHALYISADGSTIAGWSVAGAAVWSGDLWVSAAGREIYDLNAGGLAVGHAGTGDTSSVPASWQLPATTPAPLPLPAGMTYGVASAVDDSGTIVGMAGSRAVVWRNGAVTVLAGLGRKVANGRANDVRGDVIVGDLGGRAVRWTAGVATDLNAVLPRRSGWSLQSAGGLAADGTVVGSGVYGGAARGFLLRPG